MATTKATTLAHTLGGISSDISTAEINRLDGVTGDLQTQLNAKAPTASPNFTGTITAPNDSISGDAVSGGTIGAGTFNGTVTTSNDISANSKIKFGGGNASRIYKEVNSSIGETLYEGYKFFSGAMADLESGDNVGLFELVFDGVYGNAICELTTVGTINNNSPSDPDRRIIHIACSSSNVTFGHVTQVNGGRMRVGATTTSASTNGIRIIADAQWTTGLGYYTTFIKAYGGGYHSGSYGITLTVL